jgi:hypothetical protein
VRPLLVALLLCALAGAPPAAAQDAAVVSVPRLDPSVTTVVTGGVWAAGNARGVFRLVELAEGWEEIRYRVIVEWLEEDQERHELVIRAVGDLSALAPDQYSLTAPKLSRRRQRWYVTVRAAAGPMWAADRTVIFELAAPGALRRVRPR